MLHRPIETTAVTVQVKSQYGKFPVTRRNIKGRPFLE